MLSGRPYPPRDLIESPAAAFAPDAALAEWVAETFIAEGATLENPDHAHLRSARIGFLWTNVENARRGRKILGTCQLMPPHGEPWGAARAESQIVAWFGHLPDFLITLYAPDAADMENWQFCALVEHELMHAAQSKDQYGMPIFSKKTGRPVWALAGHSVEEFVGVVRRYGATSPELSAMVRYVNKGPEIAAAKIANACGTCMRAKA